jgi:hypothetical protein
MKGSGAEKLFIEDASAAEITDIDRSSVENVLKE